MLNCPLGAKTWVCRSDFFVFIFFMFNFLLPLWANISLF